MIRIGISGWRYPPWRGVFYPKDLAQKNELSYAAGIFPTVEINGTFYSLQYPDHFRQWYKATPPGFVFAVKGARYITHMLKLTKAEKPLANFFASGVLLLKEKLGPVLWQLPPNFHFHADKLEAFFALLPRTTREAAALARRHDARLKGRAFLNADAECPIRHALEIRHDSFRDPAFIRLLRKHRIALVVADTVEWPLLFDVTAGFVYCRLHGSEQLYASGYTGKALDVWAKRLKGWASGGAVDGACILPARRRGPRDVYVYFDNDAKVRAPFDAQSLRQKLGLPDLADHSVQ